MTETKRDVFGQLLNAYQNLIMKDVEIPDGNYRENITTPWNIVYDDALPDDLPVIPKAVGGLIKVQKTRCLPLSNVLGAIYNLDILRQEPSSRVLVWVKNNEKTFALAWLLGVWRVEETGEIVKLEA